MAAIAQVKVGLMQLRRLAMVVAVAVLSAVPVTPARAAICDGSQPAPRLSIRTSTTAPTPSTTVHVGGYMTGENGCIIVGARIGIFLRERPGEFTWLATSSTNARGQYHFTLQRPRQYDVLTLHSASPRAARAVSVAPDGRYYVHVQVYTPMPR